MFQYLSTPLDMDAQIIRSINLLNSADIKRICTNTEYKTKYPARKIKCDECGSPVTGKQQTIDVINSKVKPLPKYLKIGKNNNFNKVNLTKGEPVMANQTFTKICKKVLDEIKSNLICDGRKWVFVGADEPPYCLMLRGIKKKILKSMIGYLWSLEKVI